MKKLTIIYDDRTIFDGDVAEFNWNETANGVKVEGKIRKTANGGGAEQIVKMLSGMSKNKTQKMVEEKQAEYQSEYAESVEVE